MNYLGKWKKVKKQMAVERRAIKQKRKEDKQARELAARLRREEVEAYEETRPRVSFIAGKVSGVFLLGVLNDRQI